MKDVAVIGAGAWGTAIAISVAHTGADITIWAREIEVVESINTSHENKVFLPDIKLPKKLRASGNLSEVINKGVLFLVSPAQFLRNTCKALLDSGLKPSVPLVICSKGIEQKSLKLMTEVASEILANPLVILSGPTFADEVARGLPVAATVACEDLKIGKKIGSLLLSDNFKIHYTNDLIGSQISGAVKNVLAIACGIVEGKGLGENAKAVLLVQGIDEITRLCIAKGGMAETIVGLCGLGDLILTCSSAKSRNTSLGIALGSGSTMAEIMEKRNTVAEGVASADSISALSKKLKIRLPICNAVNKIIKGDGDIDSLIGEFFK